VRRIDRGKCVVANPPAGRCIRGSGSADGYFGLLLKGHSPVIIAADGERWVRDAELGWTEIQERNAVFRYFFAVAVISIRPGPTSLATTTVVRAGRGSLKYFV